MEEKYCYKGEEETVQVLLTCLFWCVFASNAIEEFLWFGLVPVTAENCFSAFFELINSAAGDEKLSFVDYIEISDGSQGVRHFSFCFKWCLHTSHVLELYLFWHLLIPCTWIVPFLSLILLYLIYLSKIIGFHVVIMCRSSC